MNRGQYCMREEHRIRVLNLEDNPVDAALVRRALQKEKIDVDYQRIDTREEFIACLDAANFDVILADHAMPRFSASDALALMQSRSLTIPFIVVSGVITEELAVTLLRQGASDYVLKDRLTRLGPAVRTALREQDLRRRSASADTALMKSEALQRSILSSLDAHIAVLDLSGKIIAVNRAWERFARANGDPDLLHTGVGCDYLKVCEKASEHDKSAGRALNGILRVLHGESGEYRCEYSCNGPERQGWYAMHVTPLAGFVGGVVVAHQNITERKLAERTLTESEDLLRGVSDSLTDGLSVLTAVREGEQIVDFDFAFVNPRAAELAGRAQEEMLGRRFLDVFPRAISAGVFDLYLRVMETGEPEDAEAFRDEGTSRRWFSVTAIKIGDGVGTTVRDITSQKEREGALSQANTRYEALGESIPGLIYQFVREADGSVHMPYVSRGIVALTGATPEELRDDARVLLDAIHPEDRADLDASIAVSEESLSPWNWQGRIIINGDISWIRGASQPLRQPDGSTLWNGLLIDVTAEMKAEEAMREARMHQQALFEQALDAVLIADDTGVFVDANPAACELLGYTREELLLMNVWDLTPGNDIEAAHASWDAFIEEGEQSGDYRVTRKDGTTRAIELRAVASVLPNRHLSVLRDVTARREAEANRARLAAIVEFSNDAILGLAPDGTIVSWNVAAERLFGYTSSEILGESIELLSPEDRRSEPHDILRKLTSGDRCEGLETVRRRKDGSTVEVSLSVSAIFDDAGRVIGVSGIARDISAQKEVLRSTLEAKARAEEMARLKTSFLTNMSHEIRTPLTGIIGFADILADLVSEEHRELTEFIAVSGERLMETLTSVLDLAQLESGHMNLNIERVEVIEQISQTMEMLGPVAKERGLHLSLDVGNSPHFHAHTDKAALNRILTNLFSNALKFTSEGGMDVSVRGDEREIWVTVRDTGIGIDSAFLPFIFDEYKQESEGTSRDYEGSGLGLTISKRLAELLNATLEVESEKGQGSTFTLRLPRADRDVGVVNGSPLKSLSDRDPIQHTRPAVLLVDDNVVVHQLVRSMIGERCDLECAVDGDEGLMLAAEAKYDAVLLDIDLGGGINGSDVLRHMRTYPGYDRVPVIAVTAHALEGDRERFLSLGFDGYVSKPFRKDGLSTTVQNLLVHDSHAEADAPEFGSAKAARQSVQSGSASR